MKKLLLFFLIFPLTISASPTQHRATIYRLVKNKQQTVADFIVELPKTTKQKLRGLMFRKKLAANRGMLFIYKKPQTVRFWMKNTFVSLDILYFNNQDQLIYIDFATVPHSRRLLGPNKPVKYVLEVAHQRQHLEQFRYLDYLKISTVNKKQSASKSG